MTTLNIPQWDYNFWFYPGPDGIGDWVVSYFHSGHFYCNYSETTGPSVEDSAEKQEVIAAFQIFKQRPEYKLVQYMRSGISMPDSVTSDQIDILADAYNECLAGAILLRHLTSYKDANIGIRRVSTMIEWLSNNKFYSAPASSQYHESFSGGLLYHSVKVLNEMIKLYKLECFQNERIESIAIAALTHDWCKIGLYHTYLRNVKNEDTGKWEQREAYKRELTGIPMGHGSTSTYYVQKFIPLTDAEALAIRWHMGIWYCHDAEVNDLQKANECYPLVHMLQFADQLAITNYVN